MVQTQQLDPSLRPWGTDDQDSEIDLNLQNVLPAEGATAEVEVENYINEVHGPLHDIDSDLDLTTVTFGGEGLAEYTIEDDLDEAVNELLREIDRDIDMMFGQRSDLEDVAKFEANDDIDEENEPLQDIASDLDSTTITLGEENLAEIKVENDLDEMMNIVRDRDNFELTNVKLSGKEVTDVDEDDDLGEVYQSAKDSDNNSDNDSDSDSYLSFSGEDIAKFEINDDLIEVNKDIDSDLKISTIAMGREGLAELEAHDDFVEEYESAKDNDSDSYLTNVSLSEEDPGEFEVEDYYVEANKSLHNIESDLELTTVNFSEEGLGGVKVEDRLLMIYVLSKTERVT